MAPGKGIVSGKKAIVTGAASGIGRAISEALAAEGATVLGVDLPSPDWSTSETLEGPIARLAIDITDPAAPGTIVDTASALLGGIDILVNNAGIITTGDAETTSDDQWNRVMAVNVHAVFRLTREAIPLLRKSAGASIINTGSIVSELAGPGIIAYVTSKHAVAGMTKAMAVDLGKYGIRANFLQPGSVVTPLAQSVSDDPEFIAYWERKIPLGRLGQPGDIAPVAVFLASDAARYISGEGLRVDGGATVNA